MTSPVKIWPTIRIWKEDKGLSKAEADHEPAPSGSVEVGLWDLLQPGVYGRFRGRYYQVDTSEHHEYIVCSSVFNHGKRHRFYSLQCNDTNKHIGISLLYVDNCHSARVRTYHVRDISRPASQWPNLASLHRELAIWETTAIADFWHAASNRYDTGYPIGPALETLDIYESLADANTGMLIPELFQEFERVMEEFRATPMAPIKRAGATRKIGVCTPASIADTITFRHSKQDSEDFHVTKDRLSEGIVAVGCLPKVGHLTSDGKLRKVFPMSPTLQIGLQNIIGHRVPKYQQAKRISGMRFPAHKYTYDVIKCDRAAYPYIRNWVMKHVPHLQHLIMPPVLTPEGHVYTEQFLSGLFGTNHFGEAFTVSIGRCLTKQTLYVQGDGLMTQRPLDLDNPIGKLLRRCEDFTINGFRYLPGKKPQYMNAMDRLTSPRLLKTRQLNGESGWAFRREIYKRFLNPCSLPPPNSVDYSKLSDLELLRLCHVHHMCLRKLRYAGVIEHQPAESHWHYANTRPREVRSVLPRLNVRNYWPL